MEQHQGQRRGEQTPRVFHPSGEVRQEGRQRPRHVVEAGVEECPEREPTDGDDRERHAEGRPHALLVLPAPILRHELGVGGDERRREQGGHEESQGYGEVDVSEHGGAVEPADDGVEPQLDEADAHQPQRGKHRRPQHSPSFLSRHGTRSVGAKIH
ncbi:MAG: hypothetical protein QF415_08600 [Candidatus Undinarchaeales archaeon]|nr:hypothetical protein [Candidatus Undinarchaeales archaeon]